MTEPGSATMPDPEVIVIACEAVPRSLRCRIGRPIDDAVLIWGLHRCQRLELNPAADLPTGAATVYFPPANLHITPGQVLTGNRAAATSTTMSRLHQPHPQERDSR